MAGGCGHVQRRAIVWSAALHLPLSVGSKGKRLRWEEMGTVVTGGECILNYLILRQRCGPLCDLA